MLPAQEESISNNQLVPPPMGGVPVIEWSDPPQCSNQPLNAEAQARLRANPLVLQRAAAMVHTSNTRTMLANGAAQNALTGLALNVASGRLNRATGLSLPDLPHIQTVGDLLDELEAGQAARDTAEALIQAGQEVQAGNNIVDPVCARLFVTQFNGLPQQVFWSELGLQRVADQTDTTIWSSAESLGRVLDGGQVSPDGKRAAFTSLGYETGGPIFLLDLKTGEWVNLIEQMNSQIEKGQLFLQPDLWWEVIGWFPDSSRLMIGPAELSAAYIVDLNTFTFQVLPFSGGGMGGSGFVQLAPDGGYFVFIANEADGSQALFAYNLTSGQANPMVQMAEGEGLLFYPRFSPDGSSLSYLVQKGHPSTGHSYAIDLYSIEERNVRTLVEGNLGPTVPIWSPDGERIAFTKKELDEPDLVVPEQVPPPMRGNVWVVPSIGGTPQQMTFVDGWARSPVWDYDSRTLAFVTHDGQVGMVDIGHPGRIWRAAETVSENPLMTSAFFLP